MTFIQRILCSINPWNRILAMGFAMILLGLKPAASQPPPLSQNQASLHLLPRPQRPAKYKPEKTFTVASYNVENLFSFHPYYAQWAVQSDKRHRQQRGKPQGQGLIDKKLPHRRFPNWLPKSQSQYSAKLSKHAQTIVERMDCPDIIALQEIENVSKKRSVLGDLVQHIRLVSKKQFGEEINYAIAIRAGDANDRDISQAFLYRRDRVRIPSNNLHSLNAQASQAVKKDNLGEMLFTRPVLMGTFEIYKNGIKAGGAAERVTILNNHFKSRPNSFVPRRTEQANYNAEMVKQLQAQDANAKVIVAGDMNINYNDLSHRIQVRGLDSLTRGSQAKLQNLNMRLPKDTRYSYLYRRRKQLLDLMYATPNLNGSLHILHINSTADRKARPSDHDPIIGYFPFSL